MSTARNISAACVLVAMLTAVLAANRVRAEQIPEFDATIIDHFTDSAYCERPQVFGTGIGDTNATRDILFMVPAFSCEVDSNMSNPSQLQLTPFMVDYVADFAMRYFDFGGEPGGLLDLTAGGVNDRFFVDIESLSGPVTLELRVYSAVRGYPFAQASHVVLNVASADSLEIPFGEFSCLPFSRSTTEGADFTQASSVELLLHNSHVPLRIDAFGILRGAVQHLASDQ